MKLRRHHCRISESPLVYLEGGRPGPRAVLFLHGLGCSGPLFFEACVDHPALRGTYALAPDLPGFGYSGEPRDGFTYSIAELALCVWELLDALGIREVAVAAHSWGGVVGQVMAAQRPGRVIGFANGEGPMRLEDCLLAPHVISEPYDVSMPYLWPRLRAYLEGLPGRAGPLVVRAMDLTTPWAWYAAYRALADVLMGDAMVEEFVALPAPRVYLLSEEVLRPEWRLPGDLAARGVPVLAVPGTSHALVADNPRSFAAVVGEVLASCFADGNAPAHPGTPAVAVAR